MRLHSKNFIIAKKGVSAKGKYIRSKSGYYYYALSGDYSLEQLADAIAQEPSVVVFDNGTHYIAVYAHTDRETTKFDKKNTTETNIALTLGWQALSISVRRTVILVTEAAILEKALHETPFKLEIKKEQEGFLNDRVKQVKKLRTGAKRNAYRVLAAIGFLTCFGLGIETMSHLKDGYFQDAIELESRAKDFEHKKKELGVLIAKENELQKNAQEYGFEKAQQRFATDFLQKKPKKIVVVGGNLEI